MTGVAGNVRFAAGLATGERHGREVRYRLNLAALGALGTDVRDALLR